MVSAIVYTPKDLGGYSVGVPPLPIPNREVKPDSADGTASSGRVGRRQLKPTPDSLVSPGFFISVILE